MLCFYQARGLQLRGSLILIFLLLSLQHLDALFSLPQNVRVDSEVEVNGDTNTYEVEEFIDKQDGSIHVQVSDLTNSSGTRDITSYYRVKELTDGAKIMNNLLVSFSHIDQLCQSNHINNWQLKEFSLITSILLESSASDAMVAIRNDRTAIGPATLLQIVQANAQLFSMKLKAFDEMHLTDMYYFMANINLYQYNQVAKIICSFPEQIIDNQLQKNVSLTAALNNTLAYPASVSVVVLDKEDADYIDFDSLITGEDKKVKAAQRLNVNFYLIQERRQSRHMGLKLGSLNEMNPFSLPSSSGCGLATRRPFYVESKQFSGLFTAKDFKEKRFIAFDSDSSHLRIDSIGSNKIIYNLDSKRLIYIDDTTTLSSEEKKINCAQSYSQGVEEDDIFHDVKAPKDILGIAQHTGLLYLGTMVLEDGSHCLVFERELPFGQIPFISKLTMRLSAKSTNRFFLIYYFVDELAVEIRNGTSTSNAYSYETLWLKRIELKSISPVSKYKILNSQVTFSEFTWSLESEVEDTSGSQGSAMRHPVRTFDTIECKSTREQTQVEFLIRQTEEAKLLQNLQDSSMEQQQATDLNQLLADRLEFVEESVMSFLTQQKGLSRSQICQLEVEPPKLSGLSQTLLIRAKLIDTLDFNFGRQLFGWIYNIDSVPFGKYGSFISSGPTARHECSMMLAINLSDAKKVDMLYCPNVGCGYIHDGKDDLQIVTKSSLGSDSRPTVSDYFYLCEVHSQTKDVAANTFTYDKLSSNIIEQLLYGSKISIDTDVLNGDKVSDQTDERQKIFRGLITKVSASSGESEDSSENILIRGSCYTDKTRLPPNEQENFDIRIQEVNLGLQHSLVHCHKACQLHPACQTYSYDRVSRVCTITNIPKRLVANYDDDVQRDDGVRNDKNCVIFSIDSLRLYKNVRENMPNSLAELSKSKNMECYVTLASLKECANLCHSNQFNCEKFEYFPLTNYCFLEDKKHFLFKSRHPNLVDKYPTSADRINWMIDLVGRQEWLAYHKSSQYKRDYLQHYALNQSSQVNIEELPKSVTFDDAQQQDQAVSSSLRYSLVAGSQFFDMDHVSCLRECSIIKKNCVMVDNYFKTIMNTTTMICAIYELMDITLSSDTTNTNHSQPGGNNSLSLSTQGTNLVISKAGCTHYYLDGDNLWLKMQLMKDFQLEKLQDDERNSLGIEDSDSSSKYSANLTGITLDSHKAGGSKIILYIFLLLVGLIFGSLINLHTPQLQSTNPLAKITSTVNRMYLWRGHRVTRSQSKIEFNELNDIHGDEE